MAKKAKAKRAKAALLGKARDRAAKRFSETGKAPSPRLSKGKGSGAGGGFEGKSK